MLTGVLLYSIVILAAAIFYRRLFQGKVDPSLSRRIIGDILCFSFILIPINKFFQCGSFLNSIKTELPTFIIFIYITGTVVLSLVFAINFLRLMRTKRHSEECNILNKKCLIHSDTQLGCFSWLNSIYLPRNFKRWNKEETQMVINHENAHIHLGHWRDLMMIQAICIFQWFNPAIWYFRKELLKVHEYEADFHVIRNSGINKKIYEYFLLKESVVPTLSGTVHNFNSESLKHRIIMMNNKNLKKDWVERFSIIFILGILMAVFL